MAIIHRWLLTENANDSVGTLNLSNNNGVTFGINGAVFNGNNFLSATYNIPQNILVSCWVAFDSGTYGYSQSPVSAYDAEGGTYTGMVYTPSSETLRVSTGGNHSMIFSEFNATNYPATTLVFVCLMYSGGRRYAWRNNTQILNVEGGTGMSGSRFRIGYGYVNASYMRGKVQDVQIWESATSVDVQAIYSAGPGGTIGKPFHQCMTGGM